MSIYIYACICIWLYAYITYVYIYIYNMYISLYALMYIYIYMVTHTSRLTLFKLLIEKLMDFIVFHAILLGKGSVHYKRLQVDSQLKNDQISYESSLKLKSLLFSWFSIEQLSNFIRIQPGALKLIIWSILSWTFIKIDMNPAWLKRLLFDWFLIEKLPNFIWIQPGAPELIGWLIDS